MSDTKGSAVLKLVSDEQFLHALYALVAVGNGVLNEVSPLDCHALVKLTLLASVPSFAPAGNDVRAVQPCHADVKYFPLLKLKSSGRLVSGVSRNAFWKLTLADALAVPSKTPDSIVVICVLRNALKNV